MTIKQHGGVFGRSPTFSEATVEGQFSADGFTFFVDATNNRAGFGTVTPEKLVEIREDVNASVSYPLFIRNESFGAGSGSGILFRNRAGSAFTEGTIEFVGTAANQSKFIVRVEGIPGSGPQIALEIDKDGNASLPAGNLVLANGKGIDFSATSGTGTSELFDDYEEGTWTATVGCTGNATTTTTVTAYYTKIGRQVTVGFRLLNNIDTTGLSGFFKIQGLPYACIAGSTAGFAGIADWSDLTYPASVDMVTPVTSNGASTIVFSTRGSGISGGLLGATQPTSGVTDITYFSLTYFTA